MKHAENLSCNANITRYIHIKYIIFPIYLRILFNVPGFRVLMCIELSGFGADRTSVSPSTKWEKFEIQITSTHKIDDQLYKHATNFCWDMHKYFLRMIINLFNAGWSIYMNALFDKVDTKSANSTQTIHTFAATFWNISSTWLCKFSVQYDRNSRTYSCIKSTRETTKLHTNYLLNIKIF